MLHTAPVQMEVADKTSFNMEKLVDLVCFSPDISKLPAFARFGDVVLVSHAKVDSHKDKTQVVLNKFSTMALLGADGNVVRSRVHFT